MISLHSGHWKAAPTAQLRISSFSDPVLVCTFVLWARCLPLLDSIRSGLPMLGKSSAGVFSLLCLTFQALIALVYLDKLDMTGMRQAFPSQTRPPTERPPFFPSDLHLSEFLPNGLCTKCRGVLTRQCLCRSGSSSAGRRSTRLSPLETSAFPPRCDILQQIGHSRQQMSLCRVRKNLVLQSQNRGVVLVVGKLPRRFCTYGLGVSGSWELPELGSVKFWFRPIFPVPFLC